MDMFGSDVVEQLSLLDHRTDGLKQIMDFRNEKEAQVWDKFQSAVSE